MITINVQYKLLNINCDSDRLKNGGICLSSEEIHASIQEIESISIVNAEKSVVVQNASEQQTSMGKIIAGHLDNLAKIIQSLKVTVSNFN